MPGDHLSFGARLKKSFDCTSPVFQGISHHSRLGLPILEFSPVQFLILREGTEELLTLYFLLLIYHSLCKCSAVFSHSSSSVPSLKIRNSLFMLPCKYVDFVLCVNSPAHMHISTDHIRVTRNGNLLHIGGPTYRKNLSRHSNLGGMGDNTVYGL